MLAAGASPDTFTGYANAGGGSPAQPKVTGGSSKGENNSVAGQPSWQSGTLNTNAISAEKLNSAMRGDVAALYARGPVQNSYYGMSDTAKGAVGGLMDAANRNAGMLNDAYATNQGLLNQEGLTDLMRNNVMQVADTGRDYNAFRANGGLTAGQQGNVGTMGQVGQGYGQIGAQAQNPSLTENTLMGVAQGRHFGENDPGFARLRQNAMDDARTAVNRQFGASGRFGSSMHAADTSRGIFDASAGLDYANYQNDIARQERALGSIEGMRQQGINNRFGALSGQQGAAQGAFGMAQQGTNNAMNALAGRSAANQAAFGMGQTGIANTFAAGDRAAQRYQDTLLPYQTALQGQNILDADKRAQMQFDPGYEHLLKYQGLLGGNAAGPQPAKKPGFMDYAGLGLGLLSAFA